MYGRDKLDEFIDHIVDASYEAKVLNLLVNGIGCDGGHHKQWYIDQAIRALVGTMYDELVGLYEERDENGEVTYEWDTGIAP